ncbi:hypothetical protein H0H93_007478 [Arthromyces matolae]|nr:hypothetical protein H0H93_007478 [Arthromyces matolae]
MDQKLMLRILKDLSRKRHLQDAGEFGTLHVKENKYTDILRRKVPENEAHDVSMFEGPSYPVSVHIFQTLSLIIQDQLLTTPTPSNINVDYYGCEYLKTIGRQLDNYATTGGEYLEAIFTHREILASYPSAHHECARGFTDIARMLEQRAWRADREADMEAVTAFRYEAWCIASTL